MRDLSVRTTHGSRDIAAALRPASRSGYWSLWAADSADAPFAWSPSGIRIARALESEISTHEAARRFPQHAEALRSRPDSSD